MFARRCLSNGALMDSLFRGENNELEHCKRLFSHHYSELVLVFFCWYTRSISLALICIYTPSLMQRLNSYQCLFRCRVHYALIPVPLFSTHVSFRILCIAFHCTSHNCQVNKQVRSHHRLFCVVSFFCNAICDRTLSYAHQSNVRLQHAILCERVYLRKHICTENS